MPPLFRRLLLPAIPAFFAPCLHAGSEGVETLGPARFTVITPQLIRMEYAADGKFVDAASWFARNRDVHNTAYRAERNDQTLTIDTGLIHLVYTDDGRSFNAKNLSAAGANRVQVPEMSIGQELIVRVAAADLDCEQVHQQAVTRRLDGLLNKAFADWTDADRSGLSPGLTEAIEAVQGGTSRRPTTPSP